MPPLDNLAGTEAENSNAQESRGYPVFGQRMGKSMQRQRSARSHSLIALADLRRKGAHPLSPRERPLKYYHQERPIKPGGDLNRFLWAFTQPHFALTSLMHFGVFCALGEDEIEAEITTSTSSTLSLVCSAYAVNRQHAAFPWNSTVDYKCADGVGWC